MKKIDIDKAKKSLEYLYEIYSEMSSNADELSKKRCPYKNAKSRCTANFECRNQHFLKNSTELPICTGSDLLDYRPAWKI
tara:strand:- start:3398 stop:3637 length:240 start_codon:yes stop_codon:yes gene_type:complete